MSLKRVSLVVLGATVLLACGCFPTARRQTLWRYKGWLEVHAPSEEALAEQAEQKGWRPVVVTERGVFELSLAARTAIPLYTTRNPILAAALATTERLVVIERRRGDVAVIITYDLGRARQLAQMRVELPHSWCPYVFSSPLLVTESYAVFPARNGLVRLDLRNGASELLEREWEDCWVTRILEARGRYYVLVESTGPEGEQQLLVVSAGISFDLLGDVPGVSNVIPAGEHVVVQQGAGIHLLLPNRQLEQLVERGLLLCESGDDSFLYDTSFDAARPWHYSGTVCNYSLDGRRSREVLRGLARTRNEAYLLHPVFVSPDGSHVFMPEYIGVSLYISPFQYSVYDLRTGHMVGAFFHPYLGTCDFGRVLGWL